MVRKIIVTCLATAALAALIGGDPAAAAPADCAAKPKEGSQIKTPDQKEAYWYTFFLTSDGADGFKRDMNAKPIEKGTCLPATTKHHKGHFVLREPRTDSAVYNQDYYAYVASSSGGYEYFYEVPGKGKDQNEIEANTRFYRDEEIKWQ